MTEPVDTSHPGGRHATPRGASRGLSSVLIANRGEIAVRLARAAREAGIRSVAVYSDADADGPHVRAADEAVHIGPTAAAESYLNIEAILGAARATGVEAIHPGYGFLSERAAFARAVTDEGLIFVGPSAEVMEAMGRKDHARTIAERAGVPVTRRYDEDNVPREAYPVLVKAAAGGGGKGMRIVTDPADLVASIASARREAATAFGDDTVLIEQYVEGGRHVEVQVMGDHAGNVVHLFDRDCSVQRRHQKVVEEAPASLIAETVRQRLFDASIALCREVGYTNAGTVEFLVKDDDAYFLEMNTRLQVEHPVTEAITGIDLVQWQLAIAAGESLPLAQGDIYAGGHAIEARVYAEDAYAGFLPQAGTATSVTWPAGGRVDEALESGQEISTAYDPMLAKIIVHAGDRDEARQRLIRALDHTAIFGVTTNLGFLRRLIDGDAFASGRIHTSWLDADADADADDGAAALTTKPAMPLEAAARAARIWAHDEITASDDPFGASDSWRLAGPPAPILVPLIDEHGDETMHQLTAEELHGVDGAALGAIVTHATIAISHEGHVWTLSRPDPARAGATPSSTEADVVSPMPGTVLSIAVEEGAGVCEGAVLGVVEAMKMELALKAPYDGIVSAVRISVGDRVALGAVLFTVDPEEAQ